MTYSWLDTETAAQLDARLGCNDIRLKLEEDSVFQDNWQVRLCPESFGARFEFKSDRGSDWSSSMGEIPLAFVQWLRLFRDKRGAWRSRLSWKKVQEKVALIAGIGALVKAMGRMILMIVPAALLQRSRRIVATRRVGDVKQRLVLDCGSATVDERQHFVQWCLGQRV